MLSCSVPLCAVLLCSVVLCSVLFLSVLLCSVLLRALLLCSVLLCPVLLFSVLLCFATPCSTAPLTPVPTPSRTPPPLGGVLREDPWQAWGGKIGFRRMDLGGSGWEGESEQWGPSRLCNSELATWLEKATRRCLGRRLLRKPSTKSWMKLLLYARLKWSRSSSFASDGVCT